MNTLPNSTDPMRSAAKTVCSCTVSCIACCHCPRFIQMCSGLSQRKMSFVLGIAARVCRVQRASSGHAGVLAYIAYMVFSPPAPASDGILLRPFSADTHGVLLVVLVVLRTLVVQRVVLSASASARRSRMSTVSATAVQGGTLDRIVILCGVAMLTGLGAERRAWIERRTVRIWSAGDHLSVDTRACVSSYSVLLDGAL